MRANRAFRLLVRREGAAPAWLADPQRVDHVEIVDVDSGEVVLYWDMHPRECKRLVKRLRVDLANMEAGDFVMRWREVTFD